MNIRAGPKKWTALLIVALLGLTASAVEAENQATGTIDDQPAAVNDANDETMTEPVLLMGQPPEELQPTLIMGASPDGQPFIMNAADNNEDATTGNATPAGEAATMADDTAGTSALLIGGGTGESVMYFGTTGAAHEATEVNPLGVGLERCQRWII